MHFKEIFAWSKLSEAIGSHYADFFDLPVETRLDISAQSPNPITCIDTGVTISMQKKVITKILEQKGSQGTVDPCIYQGGLLMSHS